MSNIGKGICNVIFFKWNNDVTEVLIGKIIDVLSGSLSTKHYADEGYEG